jgi:molybdenum cofactor guanylyltransferase
MKPTKKKSNMFRPAGRGLFGGIQVNAAGYILVGGASSRFGADKALAELGGVPMYVRMTALLKSIVIPSVLVGDPAKYGQLGITCIYDKWPGEGPLGGIITALRYTQATDRAEFNLIVSCDMPFLTAAWLKYMLTIAFNGDADVVLAKSEHGPEPLCAVWRTASCNGVELQFKRGVRRVNEAIGNLKSEVLDEAHWKRFDSAGRLFWNMNTPADYAEAQRILATEHS